MVVLQAQALLTVLGEDSEHPDPRDLPFGQVAQALMSHEKRRWRATASLWEWSSGGPVAEPLQERSIAAIWHHTISFVRSTVATPWRQAPRGGNWAARA